VAAIILAPDAGPLAHPAGNAMKIIDRYITGRMLMPLLATVSVALIALLLERMVRMLDLVMNKGGPLWLIVRMLVNLIPHYLGIALPAAFFIGVLLAVSRMSSDSELAAMHSCGVPLRRLIAPLMIFAAALVVCSAVIVGYLQPYTRYAYRALMHLMTETAWDSALEQGAFFTGFGDTTIMVDDISEGGRVLTGIFVHQEKEGGGSTTTLARRGKVVRSATDFALMLDLEQGIHIDSSGSGHEATALSFEHFRLPLETTLDPSPFRERGESRRELTLSEIWSALDHPPANLSRQSLLGEFHGRLVRIATYAFLPLLAFPLGVSTRRTRRGTGLAAGLFLIVTYHYLLEFGVDMTEKYGISPWITLWGPFALYFCASLWAFFDAELAPGQSLVSATLARCDQWFDRARHLGRQWAWRLHRNRATR
jgi:lipopolysaccharide export system permease protein